MGARDRCLDRERSLGSLSLAKKPHGRGTVVIEPTVLGRPLESDVSVNADSLAEFVVGLDIVALGVPRRHPAALRRVESEGRLAIDPAEVVDPVAFGAEPKGLGPVSGVGQREKRRREIGPIFHRGKRDQVGVDGPTVFLSFIECLLQFHHRVLCVCPRYFFLNIWNARLVVVMDDEEDDGCQGGDGEAEADC